MARLKSRQLSPPLGFMFVQPQTNWQAPSNLSFEGVVDALVAHRRGNPWICQQNNLSTDPAICAIEVDEFNAARCLMHPGWEIFVSDNSPPKSWTPAAFQRIPRQGVGAVGVVKRTAAGLSVVADWLGAGLKPVERKLAEKRAAICSTCPQNTNPNWIQKLDAVAAAQIKTLVEIKNDLKLSTSHDEKLHSCNACDCSLTLKVHAPLEHILSNTSETVRKELDKRCWILSKDGNEKNQ